ncbi:MAG: MFS transporter, partial [Clostridia bacterium]|nr:MFS transporter [Clostridia bacterium]
MRSRSAELTPPEKDIYKTSRNLYIVEAALEYFIAIIVGGAFLAKVSTSLGISDSLTGIISSFVSLGCVIQLVSIFMNRRKGVKTAVVIISIINQLLFCLIYVTPFIPLSSKGKIAVFVCCMLAANLILQIGNAPKTNWYMALVENKKRGVFTANVEIVSLIGGMIFSTVMGNLVDRFEAAGNLKGAFAVCAVTVFCLMILHTVTLLCSKEKPMPEVPEGSRVWPKIQRLLKNRLYLKAVAVGVLWNVAICSSTPFFYTYQIGELDFSLTFVAILGAIYAVVRALFSRFWGKIADRQSFATMMCICASIAGAAYVVNIFTTPANGKIFYTAYYVLTAISMAGMNSSLTNILFDYAPFELRTEALAVQRTLYGLCGFLTTLAVSPLVSHIQESGNTLFGIPMYAQQAVSAISVVIIAGVVLFLIFGIMRK